MTGQIVAAVGLGALTSARQSEPALLLLGNPGTCLGLVLDVLDLHRATAEQPDRRSHQDADGLRHHADAVLGDRRDGVLGAPLSEELAAFRREALGLMQVGDHEQAAVLRKHSFTKKTDRLCLLNAQMPHDLKEDHILFRAHAVRPDLLPRLQQGHLPTVRRHWPQCLAIMPVQQGKR